MFKATLKNTANRRFIRMAEKLKNFEPAFRKARPTIQRLIWSQFIPGNNSWKPLSAEYKKRRKFPDKPILIQSGKLRQSYREDSAHEYGPTKYKYGSTVEYASYHQSAKDPARVRALDTKEAGAVIIKLVQEYIMK